MASSTTDPKLKEMAETLPIGFTGVKDYLNGKIGNLYNIMGYVADYMPPAATSGTDLVSTIVLSDSLTGIEDSRATLKIFKKSPEAHPPVHSIGDVVIARSLQLKEYRNQKVGMLKMNTVLFVLYIDGLVEENRFANSRSDTCTLRHWKSPSLARPDAHEIQWAITLASRSNIEKASVRAPKSNVASNGAQDFNITHRQAHSVTSEAGTSTGGQSADPLRGKFSLIQDVVHGRFYDMTVEIVKIYHQAQYIELYVTDWTSNKNLRVYHAGEGNPPAGQFTLKIEVLSPHAEWIVANSGSSSSGAILEVQNVRIKWSKSGQELEGNLWPDSKNPGKLQLSFASPFASRKRDLIHRKEVHINDGNTAAVEPKRVGDTSGTALAGFEITGAKRGHSTESVEESKQSPQRLSKSKRKRLRKNKAKDQASAASKSMDQGGSNSTRAKEGSVLAPGLNTDIKADNPDLPVSSFNAFFDNPNRAINTRSVGRIPIPFINVSHLLNLRVVDFYPHDIRNFSNPELLPHLTAAYLESERETPEYWHWDFWLVVVAGGNDDPMRDVPVKVQLLEENADYLLGLSASDLRKDSTALGALRARLWSLWGDLEERKSALLQGNPGIKADESFSLVNYDVKPDNRPFLAHVQEFGLQSGVPDGVEGGNEGGVGSGKPLSEFSKFWRMFGTRIRPGEQS